MELGVGGGWAGWFEGFFFGLGFWELPGHLGRYEDGWGRFVGISIFIYIYLPTLWGPLVGFILSVHISSSLILCVWSHRSMSEILLLLQILFRINIAAFFDLLDYFVVSILKPRVNFCVFA